MTLNNIKNLKEERGFTIVELLIVIVVIAILAAIVIVAYNGITSRANAATAKANATAVTKVVEAYATDTGNGVYPSLAQLTGWTGGVTRIPTGVTVNSAQLTSSAADGKTIQFVPKGTSPNFTGGCIGYWDGAAAAYLYAGNGATGSNVSTPTCT